MIPGDTGLGRLDDILQDLSASEGVSDYEAVEVLWVALVKSANLMPGKSEHQRMLALVERMPVQGIKLLLDHPAVDARLNLDPPLETVLADAHERLYEEETKAALTKIRDSRGKEPKEALFALGEILKRIRNKRVHGFKIRKGPRDIQILGATRPLLFGLCQLALEAIDRLPEIK